MKIIRKIAGAELRHLFFSPVAWFVVILFYLIAAVAFFNWLEKMALALDAGIDLIPDFLGWQDGIYKNMRGQAFSKMFQYLYMFLPLLTMGIINREHISGSIKLLYAAPLRIRDIVMGKYLGLVCFNIILLSGIAVLLLTGYAVAQNVPILPIASALFGMFLLINTYAAIGLFVSCLTKYQIVAAVLTFVLFHLLEVLASFGQQYDFIRDVTYYFTFGSKTAHLFSGLISSKDIMYYLLIIALFLIFAMIKIRSTRESKKWRLVFSRYVLTLLVIIFIGYGSSRPGYILYWDVTDSKENTIPPAAQEVMGQLDGSPLKVTLYTNLFSKYVALGLPQNRSHYIWNFWVHYQRFYPNIEFDYVYYYDIKKGDSTLYKQYPGENMEELADIVSEYQGIRKSLFRKGAELENIKALMDEDLKTVMEVSYQGKTAFLRTIKDGAELPHPIHLAGCLKRLLQDKEVKVTFLTGHYERDAFSYAQRNFGHNTSLKFSEHSLIDRGVCIDTLSINNQNVPDDVTLLVVADPRSAYSPEELLRLEKYIQRGGNAMFLAEPGKQGFLNPLLEKIGVQVEEGIIVQPNKHGMAHAFSSQLTRDGNYMSKEFEQFQTHGINGGQVYHEGVANLSIMAVNGFKIDSIITKAGDSTIWIDHSRFVADSAAPIFDSGDVQKDAYIIAARLTRMMGDKEQRIIVSSDADYMSSRYTDPKKFNHHFYSWLMYNEYPIYTNDPIREDRFLTVDQITVANMRIVYIYLLPAFLILSVSILLLRRTKK